MDGTFSAREDSPLRPSLGHKISKTPTSGSSLATFCHFLPTCCTSEVTERRWRRPKKPRKMSVLSDFDSPDVASGPSKSGRILVSRRARRTRHFAQPYCRPICWAKTLFFQEKTRFSGEGVPPRRAAACTSGEPGSDGACARPRENGAPNRPIWLQLLLLRADGTTRPTILARFVAAAAAFAPPPPKIPPRLFRGGGAVS